MQRSLKYLPSKQQAELLRVVSKLKKLLTVSGKIERFWRTLEDDLLGAYVFDSLEHLKQELIDYLLYYNEYRPHQVLAGKSPLLFSKFCPRIS